MSTAARTAHPVCPVSELPPGGRRIVQIGARSIGIFRLEDGRYYALANRCPHRGAPLCLGRRNSSYTAERPYEPAMDRAGEILRCPWHGWEFDVTTGRSVCMPERIRVQSYPVTEETSVEKYDVAEKEGMVVLWTD